MNGLFNAIEAIFFTNIFGQLNLYTILSTALKFVFVVIILVYVGRIVRMITLDIKQTVERRPVRAASLKLLSNPANFDFPIRDEYFLSDNTSIGRADDNTIVIKDQKMSKHHAQIIQNGGAFFIDDLKATNPTRVNEEVIHQPHELHSRDLVTLGGVDFVFINGDDHEN